MSGEEQDPAAAPPARAVLTVHVTPTVTTSSFTPTKPKFGGLVKVSNTTTEVWVGGEPLSDWSGLKNPKPTGNLHEFCQELGDGQSHERSKKCP